MTKEELKKHIDLYKKTEQTVFNLDKEYGIEIWNSKDPNFYNNYNLLIHNLLVIILGESNVNLLEEYIWDQIDISFDELCSYFNLKDETDNK